MNLIPVTKINSITYSKYELFEQKPNTRYLDSRFDILPYIQDRFDKHLISFFSRQTRARLISHFDNNLQEGQYDTINIYQNTFISNYVNSLLYNRKTNDYVNVIRFNLETLFDPVYFDENFWFNNEVLIPTKYYDKNTGKRIALKLKNSILESITTTIPTNSVAKCNISLICCFVEHEYYDYNPSDWAGYDTFTTYYSHNIDVPIASIEINKKSNVSISNKKKKGATPLYIYDVKNNQLERYNGFFTISEPFSHDIDTNFYIIQTVYENSCIVNFGDFIVPDKLDNDYIIDITTRNHKFEIRLYTVEESKNDVPTRSVSGKCVIEWL